MDVDAVGAELPVERVGRRLKRGEERYAAGEGSKLASCDWVEPVILERAAVTATTKVSPPTTCAPRLGRSRQSSRSSMRD